MSIDTRQITVTGFQQFLVNAVEVLGAPLHLGLDCMLGQLLAQKVVTRAM